MNDVPGNSFLFEAMTALVAGILGTPNFPSMHLIKGAFTPTTTVKLGDVTAADFDGYLPVAITGWGTPHLLASGEYAVQAIDLLSWTPTGGTTPNDIGGWIVVDHAGETMSCGKFNPAVHMEGTETTLQMTYGFCTAPWTYQSQQIV